MPKGVYPKLSRKYRRPAKREMPIELQEKGYHSDFYWRAEDAIQAIDWYLGKPNAADAMREIEQKIANGTKMTIETLDEYRYGK